MDKMEPIILSQIIRAAGGSLISRTSVCVRTRTGRSDIKISGISTDTRTISSGDLFIALKGEKFDGHSFLEEAFKKGAIGAIVSKNIKNQKLKIKNKVIIKVEDTLKALGDIAKIYRERFDVPVVAISGSNGKTTTKEMLGHILSEEFNTVKAKASFNNFVGVPLTFLEIKEDTQVVILEMETNLLGGITRLCEIARPVIGIVTNIGDTHLEFLKTRENVFKEKSELIGSLPSCGTAVLNSDDPYAAKMRELVKGGRVTTFGIRNKSDFRASCVEIKDKHLEFILSRVGNNPPEVDAVPKAGISNGVNGQHKVKLNTILYGNVYNGLAAVAVAHSVFGLNLKEIIAKLREFSFPPMRMELINFSAGGKDIKVINDSYNANPQSMKEALFTLKNIYTPGRKIAVLGDMLELGEKAPHFHYWVGKLCRACQIDILITVGSLARHIARGAKDAGIVKESIFTLDDIRETTETLSHILKPEDVVLIKGSRRMKMEEIADTLSRWKTEGEVKWQK